MSETRDETREVQLLAVAWPRTAADTDPESCEGVQEEPARRGFLPDTRPADGAYGRDENVQSAPKAGVDLVSPVNVSKRDPDTLPLEDFALDASTERVPACPAGHAPLASPHDPGTGRPTTRFAAVCAPCPLASRCPGTGQNRRPLLHTPAQRRRAERYRAQQQAAFRETYAKRAGLEGTVRRLKHCTGPGRLRGRGRPAVLPAIRLKVAGWNGMQAARSPKRRAHLAPPAPGEALRARREAALDSMGAPARPLVSFQPPIRAPNPTGSRKRAHA